MVHPPNRLVDLSWYARDNPVGFTLANGLPLPGLLPELHVTEREFAPLPPPGSVDFDFNAGRVIGLIRDDPSSWTIVSEMGFRFDGIEFVEAAPPNVTAIYVGFFHNGLFAMSTAGAHRRMFQLSPYNPSGALEEEKDLPLDDYQLRVAALMLLIERITGVPVEPFWFTGPYPYLWQPHA